MVHLINESAPSTASVVQMDPTHTSRVPKVVKPPAPPTVRPTSPPSTVSYPSIPLEAFADDICRWLEEGRLVMKGIAGKCGSLIFRPGTEDKRTSSEHGFGGSDGPDPHVEGAKGGKSS
jgi:hypothetical protein